MASSSRSKSRRTRAARGGKRAEAELDLGTDKLYFKIGEVAQIVGVPTHVLRYWEGEFRAVRPQKSRNHQRVYRRRDVEVLLKIKHLLYERKFTIAGARQELKEAPQDCPPAAPDGLYLLQGSLRGLRAEIDAIEQLVRQIPGPEAADPAAYLQVARAPGTPVEADGSGGGRTPQPLLEREPRAGGG